MNPYAVAATFVRGVRYSDNVYVLYQLATAHHSRMEHQEAYWKCTQFTCNIVNSMVRKQVQEHKEIGATPQ